MNSDWEQLLCPYFETVCHKVLEKYFSDAGFLPIKTRIGGVLFSGRGVFVEVSYLAESAPRYAPSLIVGIGNDKYDSTGKSTGIPLWHVIPDEQAERRYSFWKFTNENDLERVLEKIRAEILERYVRPLWENREYLVRMIENFAQSAQR